MSKRRSVTSQDAMHFIGAEDAEHATAAARRLNLYGRRIVLGLMTQEAGASSGYEEFLYFKEGNLDAIRSGTYKLHLHLKELRASAGVAKCNKPRMPRWTSTPPSHVSRTT